MRAALDLGRKRAGVERPESLRLGRLDHADEARAQAGQGHERERTGLGVELGGNAVVRPRVAEIERERRLGIVAPLVSMPAAARQGDLRPSAPTTSRACTLWPSSSRSVTSSRPARPP